MSVIIENEKDLYIMLINEFRYAIRRDNHLAPGTCIELIYKYLPKMQEPLRSQTARQLADESIGERILVLPLSEENYKIYHYGTENKIQLDNDELWESLLRFLLNYLTDLPYKANQYMMYLYGHMEYYIESAKGIDWYSEEIIDKILSNKKRIQKEVR